VHPDAHSDRFAFKERNAYGNSYTDCLADLRTGRQRSVRVRPRWRKNLHTNRNRDANRFADLRHGRVVDGRPGSAAEQLCGFRHGENFAFA
jgi:hypothetical protein